MAHKTPVERIREVLEELNITQVELSQRYGIHKNRLWRQLSGETELTQSVLEILQLEGISADWILGDNKQTRQKFLSKETVAELRTEYINQKLRVEKEALERRLKEVQLSIDHLTEQSFKSLDRLRENRLSPRHKDLLGQFLYQPNSQDLSFWLKSLEISNNEFCAYTGQPWDSLLSTLNSFEGKSIKELRSHPLRLQIQNLFQARLEWSPAR